MIGLNEPTWAVAPFAVPVPSRVGTECGGEVAVGVVLQADVLFDLYHVGDARSNLGERVLDGLEHVGRLGAGPS